MRLLLRQAVDALHEFGEFGADLVLLSKSHLRWVHVGDGADPALRDLFLDLGGGQLFGGQLLLQLKGL